MFTKNPFNKKDEVADLIGNILEADYKVKKEELKGNQHKIDMNKNNKIDAHDFKLLRSKGASQKDEEIDPNKVTTDTLKGRTPGKSANPFLSQKAFMDVPDNVKEEAKGVTEGSEQDDDYSNASFEKWKQQKAYEKEYDKKKPAKPIVPDNKDKKRGVAEEVEQIDELSSSTIDSYRKKLGAKIDTTRTTRPSLKAAIQAKNAPIQAKIHNALMKQHQAIRRERGMSEGVVEEVEGVEEAYQKNLNPHDDLATRGISRISMNKTPAGKKKEFDRGTELLKRQMKTTKATGGVSGPKGKLPEEVELDEEHLLVAKSELKKHKDWMDSEGYDTKTKPLPVNHPKHKTHVEIKPNSPVEHSYHLDGYAVKEEVEQLDERELTKGETKEKERIVKGMKKSLSGFKQRYGDRAKSVMYATATKAAKKD